MPLYWVAMYIDRVPNRNSKPTYLLRISYRDENGKVKKRTLANLSKLPMPVIDGLRLMLRGAHVVADFEKVFDVVRSRPYGHVAAVLGTLRRLGLDRLIARQRSRTRDLVVAMIVARVLNPQSKLATVRGLRDETLMDALGEALGIEDTDENELYAAMDWLLPRQEAIEKRLAKRHLENGTLVLYDVTSVYFEGTHCPLGRRGHSRDGKHDKLQIVIGLLCNREGCPVAVEVFEGNWADPRTVGVQIDKLCRRFSLSRAVLVGDRGMLTDARIREEVKPAGLDWISALRGPAIRKLVVKGALQLSLFDEMNMAEITDEQHYPGERLVVCRNPATAAGQARTREGLLQDTERELERLAARTQRSRYRLKGKDQIGLSVGKVIDQRNVAKYFILDIQADGFTYRRNEASLAREAALDGIYIIRTSVKPTQLSAAEAVRAYKSLSQVENAFRSMKSVDLKVRPIYHYKDERVRAHVLLCMLAYYVEWNMRAQLAPLLFDDDDPAGAEVERRSAVAAAQPSPAARRKASTKRTAGGRPVHSFQSLLKDLATITKNLVRIHLPGVETFSSMTLPTDIQEEVFRLLGVRLKM